MSKLTLITTETFGDLSCNFYRNMNDDILLTREQIGQALEYADPSKAIRKIHLKHKDRLDELCLRIKGSTQIGANLTKSEEQERVYYTERGIMEICRWSRQPKANLFMDWVWDVIEAYRHNELTPQINLQPLADTIKTLTQITTQLQKDIQNLKSTQLTTKTIPIKEYSYWKTSTFEKLKALTLYANIHSSRKLKLSLSDTMHITINRMEKTYDFDLADYVIDYMTIHNLRTKPYYLDVIDYYKEIKNLYNITINSLLNEFNINVEDNTENIEKDIFDELMKKKK